MKSTEITQEADKMTKRIRKQYVVVIDGDECGRRYLCDEGFKTVRGDRYADRYTNKADAAYLGRCYVKECQDANRQMKLSPEATQYNVVTV